MATEPVTRAERPTRPVPALSDDNRSFWTCGADGELRIMRCSECSWYVHPPRPVCPQCLSRSLAPAPVSGRATVESFTINYRQWNPNVEPPYVIARVELVEQPALYLVTNIVNTPVEAVTFGMGVRVVFEQVTDEVWLPLFEPELSEPALFEAGSERR